MESLWEIVRGIEYGTQLDSPSVIQLAKLVADVMTLASGSEM